MKVYVEEIEYGECGNSTDLKDSNGDFLHIGDIVVIIALDEKGRLEGKGVYGLEPVVEKRSDEDGVLNESDFFIMGLANVDWKNTSEWKMVRVKKWDEIIAGEKYSEKYFRYVD